MTTSLLLSQNLGLINQTSFRRNSLASSNFLPRGSHLERKYGGFVPNCKENGKRQSKKTRGRRRSWWQRFFFDDEGNWLGLKEDDMLEDQVTEEGSSSDEVEEKLSEAEKFDAWKRRAEAIVELREAQEDMLNEESRRWEDWIVDDVGSSSDGYYGNGSWWSPRELNGNGGGIGNRSGGEESEFDPSDLVPRNDFVQSVKEMVLGKDDEDLLYEDRVFRFASLNSAKYLAVLILIPWVLDFAVHDYVLMPFLDRLELQDEWRLENRTAFANIWSDMVFGISLFLLLYFNQNKVALLKFTGYKILNNVTDTGKAFMIILITDIFLGYHSESGWETLLEVFVEHYGLQVDPSTITIFVCFVPVVIDACVKLWVCSNLDSLSFYSIVVITSLPDVCNCLL
ncbi:unnamed protein product [Linum tenue]|uniref:Chloroplast envelope membrane protein n=1 Tax=Linum tenue TaxID=586396 RepID=A0AAV0S5P5_9ROSI|nr:unnamed protein product [Linum tenue]